MARGMDGNDVGDGRTMATLADAMSAISNARNAIGFAATSTAAAADALYKLAANGNGDKSADYDAAAKATLADALASALGTATRMAADDIRHSVARTAATADILDATNKSLNAAANGAVGTSMREARRVLNGAERTGRNATDGAALASVRGTLDAAAFAVLDGGTSHE